MRGSLGERFWLAAKRNNFMATRGVIDVGTNSVKLLVAEVSGSRVDPLFEGSEQTRLGAGFYETHRLLAEPIQKTAVAVRGFVEKAARFGTKSLQVIATSAARDAVNQNELLDAIHGVADVELTVISGDLEADWAFAGVASDPELSTRALLVMDIGGGSTEFILGASGQRRAGRSFQLGSVRLLEKFQPSDPPTDEQREICLAWLRSFFAGEIGPFLKEHCCEDSPTLVSTGGTASILGRVKWGLSSYNREKIEGTFLTAAELAAETQRLWRMRLEERKRLPGLPSSRADVIIMGVAILEAAVEALGFSGARVSTRGLRYGALLHAERISEM
jgi:exopolyphosphatase / guanosine-5'-triphosphate,3'-diphosphate pyrophosphatase